MSSKYLPNAWLSNGQTYFVAQHHPDASDTNPGAQELPFKTISAAAAVTDTYDRVVIDGGVYREQVSILRQGTDTSPRSLIVFEAMPGQEVYVKGSDVFDPTWQEIDQGIYRAPLAAHFFEDGAYNPYEMACTLQSSELNYQFDRGGYDPRGSGGVIEAQQKVRPTEGDVLPQTLGQIYVDGQALEQLDSMAVVRKTANSFVISADGKHIICHFANDKLPVDKLVELTARQRCFKAEYKFSWKGLMIQTQGLVAEHAAEPGAFSYCRPLSIRRNRETKITVRKTLHMRNQTGECVVLRNTPFYPAKDDPAIVCHVAQSDKPCRSHQFPVVAMVSRDGAKTWEELKNSELTRPAQYFLDEDSNMLTRHYPHPLDKDEIDWGWGPRTYELRQEVSRDAGKTWGPPQTLDFGPEALCYSIMKLQDGSLFWITAENRPQLSSLYPHKPDPFFFITRTWLGKWRADMSAIDWESAGKIQVGPETGMQGVDEPHACQLGDGKLFAIFRQCDVLPKQDSPGFTSVSLFAVSEDNGRTWTTPAPLTFDDGQYVYSPTSIPDTLCSSKNGRLYVILNILNRPTAGCMPRMVLHIAEVDKATFCIKRDTVTIIEESLEDHSRHVAFSNWRTMEDRYTKNLLLFMKMDNSLLPYGYDYNSYRYEIEFSQ